MKKKNWWQWLLLIAVLSVLGYSLWAVDAVGSHLQYIVETEDDVAAAFTDLNSLSEEWDTTQRAWTLGGFIQEAAMKAENQSARGRVSMCSANSQEIAPLTLLYGRFFTENELTGSELVALLDEQLAFALFREIDVLDRTFTLGGLTFRVIGVVDHVRQVGDYSDYGAYVPLLCGLQPDALIVEADPMPGVGANVSFSGVCNLWRSDGTFIDLHKEAVGATLWARVLAFIIGAILLVKGIFWLNDRVRYAIAWHHSALQRKYATQLLPQTIGVILAFILGYGVAAGFAALLLDFILQPVYVFPECVPSVLVEWEEIKRTFWQVQQSGAGFRELRTSELIRLRYFAGVIPGCCAVMAVLIVTLFFKKNSSTTEK